MYTARAKQIFDIVRTMNDTVKDNVINNGTNKPVGTVTPIIGADYNHSESNGLNGTSVDSELNLETVYVGVERQMSQNSRLGGLFTAGKSNIDYTDIDAFGKSVTNTDEGMYYQGSIFYTYENNFKFTSMAYVGMNDSELTRHDDTSKYTADVKDVYVGLDNEISKRFDLNIGKLYVTPKAELNITYLMQDDVDEDNGGVAVSGYESVSVEAGLGGSLGRDFNLGSKGSKINIEGSLMAYAELADPYKDTDVDYGVGTAKLNSYLNNDYYGEVEVKASFRTEKELDVHTGVNYIMGNEDEGWNVNVGASYKF
jgi:outer membrane autotransporter protein